MSSALRQFTQDRDSLFDLEQTDVLFKLAKVPQEQRDAAWVQTFLPAAWCASLQVGSPFRGPDGWPYLRMHLPRPYEPFESNSIGNVVRAVLDGGMGIAVFPSPEAREPLYVFNMGVLSSLLEYDSWQGDPVDLADIAGTAALSAEMSGGMEAVSMEAGAKIFVGSPAETILPAYTARALHRHLHEVWKIAEPRIALLFYAGAGPRRNLVINRKLSEFPAEAEAARQCNMLLWYLPPKRAIMLMPESWKQTDIPLLSAFFAPLAT